MLTIDERKKLALKIAPATPFSAEHVYRALVELGDNEKMAREAAAYAQRAKIDFLEAVQHTMRSLAAHPGKRAEVTDGER